MRHLKRTLLLSLLPLLLFGIIWRVNWRREHPPATANDKRARALLLTADTVKVRLESTIGKFPHDNYKRILLAKLKPADLMPITAYINEGPQGVMARQGIFSGSCLYFEYCKQGHLQGTLSMGYSTTPDPPLFRAGDNPNGFAFSLHSTSVRRLQQFITQHPEIMRALLKAGATPQELKPGYQCCF